MGCALLVVDFQNDFCPGGALPVPDADSLVPRINQYISIFNKKRFPVIASRDWHPKKTAHFKAFGGQWPPHCIQRTKGARFRPKLRLPAKTIVVSKGTGWEGTSYSAFLGKDKRGRPLFTILKKRDIDTIFICGVATDFCVKATALEAVKFGFEAVLLTDAVKGITPEGSRKAVRVMAQKGVVKKTLKGVKKRLE